MKAACDGRLTPSDGGLVLLHEAARRLEWAEMRSDATVEVRIGRLGAARRAALVRNAG